MSDGVEAKHLRGKLAEWQAWMNEEIRVGHIDVKNTPACYDRPEEKPEDFSAECAESLATTCYHCSLPLGDHMVTDDNLRRFHPGGCKQKFEEKEEKALKYV